MPEGLRAASRDFAPIGWLALVPRELNPRVHNETLFLDGSWSTETSVRKEDGALVYRRAGERRTADDHWPIRLRSADSDAVARVLALNHVGDVRRGLRALATERATAIAERRPGRLAPGWPNRIPDGWTMTSSGALLRGNEVIADQEEGVDERVLTAWSHGIEPDAFLAYLLAGDITVPIEELGHAVSRFTTANPEFRPGWWTEFVAG
jgi:hypothetical protein